MHQPGGLRRGELPSVEELRARGSYHPLYFDNDNRVLRLLRRSDPAAIEASLRFLEADPRHNDSGYLKEKMWPVFKRLPLSGNKRRRLEYVALAYLDRVVGREFWDMCRTMARIAGPGFWVAVTELARRDDARSTRARWLLVHGVDLYAGAMLRRSLAMESLMRNSGKINEGFESLISSLKAGPK